MDMITQDILSKILRAEKFLEESKAAVKAALSGNVPVEPGPIEARIEACTKRTPDFKSFVMKQFGPEKVFELREQAKPTNYIALHIKYKG